MSPDDEVQKSDVSSSSQGMVEKEALGPLLLEVRDVSRFYFILSSYFLNDPDLLEEYTNKAPQRIHHDAVDMLHDMDISAVKLHGTAKKKKKSPENLCVNNQNYCYFWKFCNVSIQSVEIVDAPR